MAYHLLFNILGINYREDDIMSNINSGDTAFVLICAALVLLMTPGLAFFYGGLARRKNVFSIMFQSFIAMGVVTVIWLLGGFSLAFGKDVGGIIGNFQYFGLRGVGAAPNSMYGAHIPFIVFCLYQCMFAVITPALITGAFAGRINFKTYLKFLVLWIILIYLPICHWVWGGGFLQKLGVVDFAGGIVVHLSAGIAALSSILFVGRRNIVKGESTKPHDIKLVALGTGLLWFGWFGFNGGSALAANSVAAYAFINTNVAAAFAMIIWLILSWNENKKPSFVDAMTGAVAGLATITPCAGYVKPVSAAAIGILASLVCYKVVNVMNKSKLDDALDVWGVHGVGGILGSILVGVFAESSVNGVSGLIEGNVHQLLIQLLAVIITAAYSFIMTYIIFKVINVNGMARVKNDTEIKGLDSTLKEGNL